MELKRKKYGHLECIEKEGAPGGPTIILLHGFGASQEDLAPLSNAIQVAKGVRWIFPNGPHKVELGPHMEGRAWYPLSLRELQEAQMSGLPLDFSQITPPGMGKASKLICELIRNLNLVGSKYILGGFSQGAIVATEVVMHLGSQSAGVAATDSAQAGAAGDSIVRTPQASGLCLLSGTLVSKERWVQMTPHISTLPVYMSHGKFDPVLPFTGAKALQDLFLQSKMKVQFREFHGQHEIPSQVLQDLSGFFRSIL